jgi:hypothetical protein
MRLVNNDEKENQSSNRKPVAILLHFTGRVRRCEMSDSTHDLALINSRCENLQGSKRKSLDAIGDSLHARYLSWNGYVQ